LRIAKELVVRTLAREFNHLLSESPKPPCLSLYQPTHRHHPSNRQDPIRFKNLLANLHESLLQSYSGVNHEALLHPLRALAEDRTFWQQTLDGLGVLASPGTFRIYRLQRPVPERALVSESYHVKPLIRILQSADRYQLLALSRHTVRLFEGNRDVIDEVALDPQVPRTMQDALGTERSEPHLTGSTRTGGGAMVFHGHGSRSDERDADAERFFRAVDRTVWTHHSRPSGLPLFLAALPEHHAMFRRISRNGLLAEGSISINPESLDIDTLCERGWQVEEPRYLALTAELVERFHSARVKDLASDELANIANAAAQGRVGTLIVDADRHIPGRLDPASGNVELIAAPDSDDLLDDIGELVLRRGGETVVIPPDRMPTRSAIAAIYRY
jgi:hypothetical protein